MIASLMVVKTTKLKPKFQSFLAMFILMMAFMLTVRVILHLTTSINALDVSTAAGWINLFIYPFFVAIGVTLGNRKLQLEVNGSVDLGAIKDWTLEYLKTNGLKVCKDNEDNIEFESNYWFNRLFNNWFGTEIVNIRQEANKILISGPERHLSTVDLKLKFSQHKN